MSPTAPDVSAPRPGTLTGTLFSRNGRSTIPGLEARGPSFKAAGSRHPQMKFRPLQYSDLMLRSERRERLEAWAAGDSSPNRFKNTALRLRPARGGDR